MTDKELVQQRIDELQLHISEGRSTGKTYRAINKCIEELFTKPIGSQIHLIDDPAASDNEGVRSFAQAFAKRMQRDFPDTDFKIQYPAPGVAIVVRKSETYQETARKRLEQWNKKIKEMD